MFFNLNTISLVGIVIALFWYFSRSTFNYWKKLKIPYKKPVAFFGNAYDFALFKASFHDNLHSIYNHFPDDPFGGFFEMRSPVLLLKDPTIVTHVLIKDFKSFVNRGFTFTVPDKELNPFSGHLFLSDGDRWRALRSKMSPVFTSGKLKYMYEQIFQCVGVLNQFVERNLKNDSCDVDVKELFERFTIDVIGTCAFGLECNSLKDSNAEFQAMGVKIFKPTFANAIRVLFSAFSPKLIVFFKIADVKKEITEFFLNVILSSVTYRRKNNVERNDFLQLLMELQNTSSDPKYSVGVRNSSVLKGEEFDEIDVAANAFLFFAAGFETTASTLSFCLYELAINQDIQEKLRQEVETVKTQCGGKLTAECLKDFNYMDMVLAETLRKYPPLPVLHRESVEDYVIPDTKIRLPARTKIQIPVYSIHHDWKYYPNPEKFDPERFNAENKLSRMNGTYIPFGDGPRYCIGKRFAYMEMKAALADIMTKYEFSPCNKTQIPLSYKHGSILMSPKNGIWLNISKIK
ncbi:probable cytochrome P450 6a14 [Planococcus citri]|uniref:probable cytochrome P450 6a14 n=1 Tax=Planococcus citri TaxID=170843 RepID=UPI0031F94091